MVGQLRSTTGLILMAFVLCHYTNHAFGLHSLELMQKSHPWLMGAWRTIPGQVLLFGSLVIHAGLAVRSIIVRRSLKLAIWEWAQLVTGLSIPFLLAEHIIATRGMEVSFGIKMDYNLIMAVFWVGAPIKGIQQFVAMLVVWGHGWIGLHYWLRTKEWYSDFKPWLVSFAIAFPTLALAGYIAAGFETLTLSEDPDYIQALQDRSGITMVAIDNAGNWTRNALIFLACLVVSPLLYRPIRKLANRLKGHPQLSYSDGRHFPVEDGASVLDTLRANGVPHAAVCGGRGRCTTCRVQITAGAGELPPAEGVELKALARIGAPPNLRLACQVCPTKDISVTPLLPPNASARDGRRPGGLEGQERQIATIFIDIRGSTKLGEEKLPYDVLFILNQFFSEMTAALRETGGHYAQFTGDGLMAIYGLKEDDPTRTVKGALDGAGAMLKRLEGLNQHLESELPFPLRIGIGIHFGEAIVGVMGPPDALITTAIGDNINIAARLESLSKEYGKPLILSHAAAEAGKLDMGDTDIQEVQVRGRDQAVRFYALDGPPAA